MSALDKCADKDSIFNKTLDFYRLPCLQGAQGAFKSLPFVLKKKKKANGVGRYYSSPFTDKEIVFTSIIAIILKL